MFIGRNDELQQLENKYGNGKSSLVEKFAENKKYFCKFEGIEILFA